MDKKFDAEAFAARLYQGINDAYQLCNDATMTPSEILAEIRTAIEDAILAARGTR